jgi:hypothetical protein
MAHGNYRMLAVRLEELIDLCLESGILVKDFTVPISRTIDAGDIITLLRTHNHPLPPPLTPDTITRNLISHHFPPDYAPQKSKGGYHFPPLALAAILPLPGHSPGSMECSPGIRAQIVQHVAEGHTIKEAAYLGARLRALNDPRTPPSIIKAIEDGTQVAAPLSLTTVRRYIERSPTPTLIPRPRHQAMLKAWETRHAKADQVRANAAWDAAYAAAHPTPDPDPSATPPPAPTSDSIWAKVRAPHNPDDPGSE